MNIFKACCLPMGILSSAIAWSADTCNGKNATKVVNTDAYQDTIWLYGTSNNDVWVVKGNNSAQMMIFFDLQAAHVAVDDAPAGSASGGDDRICIVNEKARASIYIRGQYKNYIKTKGPNVHLMTNLTDDEGAGRVTFIADYTAPGQHNYSIYGSNGNDNISILVPNSFGFSQIYGQDGDDNISLDEDQDNGGNYVWGGDGKDLILGSAVNDIIIGGAGIDEIYGNGGEDLLIGSDAEVSVPSIGSVYSKAVYIYQNGAKATFENDLITLDYESSASEIYGGSGDDVILGSKGNDNIEGNSGNDWIYGYDGSDRIYLNKEKFNNGSYCWEMADGTRDGCFSIETETDNDGGIIDGGEGNDILWGSDGDDEIIGGKGNDRSFGMEGNDKLWAGSCSGTRNYIYAMGGSDKVSYCSGDWVFTGNTNGFIAD